VSRLRREIVKKKNNKSSKITKKEVISMTQPCSKAPEKSHAIEQLVGYNYLYGTYLGHIFRLSVYGFLDGRIVALLIDGLNIE